MLVSYSPKEVFLDRAVRIMLTFVQATVSWTDDHRKNLPQKLRTVLPEGGQNPEMHFQSVLLSKLLSHLLLPNCQVQSAANRLDANQDKTLFTLAKQRTWQFLSQEAMYCTVTKQETPGDSRQCRHLTQHNLFLVISGSPMKCNKHHLKRK